MPSALVFVANGTEEMEAVITVDVLRRGNVKFIILCITLHYRSFESFQLQSVLGLRNPKLRKAPKRTAA